MAESTKENKISRTGCVVENHHSYYIIINVSEQVYNAIADFYSIYLCCLGRRLREESMWKREIIIEEADKW